MRGGLLVLAVLCIPFVSSAQASDLETKCVRVEWSGVEEATAMLNHYGRSGWVLTSFLKGSAPCFQRRRGSRVAVSHKCYMVKWQTDLDLTEYVQREATKGWELVGSPRPAMPCFAKVAHSTPRRATRMDGGMVVPDERSGDSNLNPRSEKERKAELRRLTILLQNGEIDREEYERRKRILQAK